MKKLILLLIVILISGCSFNSDNIVEDDVIEDNIKENYLLEEVDEYTDDNPIKLGLFLYDNNYSNKQRLIDTYYTTFTSGVDIGSFEVFLTDEEIIDGTNFKNTWNKYYNNYEDIDDYKIGFNIKFVLKDGTIYSGNFLEPDIYKFSNYFYVYLYDDIHQEDNSSYSHLESMEENTLLTSIKIYAVDGIDEVDSFILSCFSYLSEEDFDSDGNYRGDSIYVIRIKRK